MHRHIKSVFDGVGIASGRDKEEEDASITSDDTQIFHMAKYDCNCQGVIALIDSVANNIDT